MNQHLNLLNVLKTSKQDYDFNYIIIEHNISFLLNFCSDFAMMGNGEIKYKGNKDGLYTLPEFNKFM
jgi:ABC-type dipeptide/oligopeptide/nickel transport system ATPase subunit